MSVKVACPNCLEPAEKTGNMIVCPACDVTYKITQTGPAKVRDIGRIDSLEARIKRLEESTKPDEPPAPADEIEDEDDGGDDLLPP